MLRPEKELRELPDDNPNIFFKKRILTVIRKDQLLLQISQIRRVNISEMNLMTIVLGMAVKSVLNPDRFN